MHESQIAAEDSLLVRLERAAASLEAGGLYGGGKLLRGAAFALTTRDAYAAGPLVGDDLRAELIALTDAVRAAGMPDAWFSALGAAQNALAEGRELALAEAPALFVCRACGTLVMQAAPERCSTCGERAITFREFIPTYFLEPLPTPALLDALESAEGELRALVAGLSDAQMDHQPVPAEWGVRDVISHLLFAERLLAERVRLLLNETDPDLAGAAVWNYETDPRTAGELLDAFAESRGRTLIALSALTAEGWERSGRHSEFGRVTVRQQASYFARHERHHFPQIEQIRRLLAE
ncbi:MAG TPA: DinB family protein [Candidatus Limnocylindrales bacterium]|nr:DinB family protein [Candidatus Limnocylindrales bacterium]